VQWSSFPEIAGMEVVRRGINGETTAQMRMRFESDVLALRPDVVVLQMGINDLTGIGVLPGRKAAIVAQCAENISFFVDTLASHNIRTLLLTIIPPGEPDLMRQWVWSDEIAGATAEVNRRMIQLPWRGGVQVVDTGTALADAAGRPRAGVYADTLHLTPRGYEFLNAVIAPLVRP
jgi:lysophospholipase L1-like esterase